VRRFLGRGPFEFGRPLTAFVTQIGKTKREKGTGEVLVFGKGANLTPEVAHAVKLYAEGFRAILTYPTLGDGGPKLLPDPTAQPQAGSFKTEKAPEKHNPHWPEDADDDNAASNEDELPF